MSNGDPTNPYMTLAESIANQQRMAQEPERPYEGSHDPAWMFGANPDDDYDRDKMRAEIEEMHAQQRAARGETPHQLTVDEYSDLDPYERRRARAAGLTREILK